MGTLTYDRISKVVFDDRVLVHLQMVIANKMRRGESFNFSWANPLKEGAPRVTVWMHPAIPLVYEFDSPEEQSINKLWLEDLMVSANSPKGLRITPEPVAIQLGSGAA